MVNALTVDKSRFVREPTSCRGWFLYQFEIWAPLLPNHSLFSPKSIWTKLNQHKRNEIFETPENDFLSQLLVNFFQKQQQSCSSIISHNIFQGSWDVLMGCFVTLQKIFLLLSMYYLFILYCHLLLFNLYYFCYYLYLYRILHTFVICFIYI